MGDSALIVGGDSLIGRELAVRLKSLGFSVCRTSRREAAGAPDVVGLHLAPEGIYDALKDRDFDIGIICAGVTSLRACRTDPVGSREVNVSQTVEVAKRLAGAGAFVVFLSTNLVFDGMKPAPAEDDDVCPCTEYGRQKAETESHLRKLGPDIAVIRMTKILHRSTAPAAGWLRELRADRPIEATDDAPASILDLRDAVAGIAGVASRRAAGTWHFSNPEDSTYFQLAGRLARHLGVEPGLVRAVAWEEIAGAVEHRPAFAALGARRTSRELSLVFAGADAVIRALADDSQP